MVFIPGPRDADGFNDDEKEAFHKMHQTRIEFEAKLGCLCYTIFLITVIVLLFFYS